MPLVVFRADGGPSIGSGHVMRCLALAGAFAERGWRTVFASSEESFSSIAALKNSGCEVLRLKPHEKSDPKALIALLPQGADVLVMDHYGLDAVYERGCRPWAKRIVVIDDLVDRPHDADFLFDAAADEASYRALVPATCRVCAGPQFAIIGPAFRAARNDALARRDGRRVERILLSFGQVDPPNATGHALAALEKAQYRGQVDVVLGSSAPHLNSLRAQANDRVKLHIDVSNMAALMQAADFSLGAGGVTAWERACLGLPTILIEIAENQRRIIAILEREGAAISAGPLHERIETQLSHMLQDILPAGEKRIEMARAAGKLVDGRGLERILETLS